MAEPSPALAVKGSEAPAIPPRQRGLRRGGAPNRGMKAAKAEHSRRYVHLARKLASGAHARTEAIARVDLRTRQGRLLRAVRDELLEHVGARPTPVERMLIQRASVLSLRLAQIDRKIFDEAEFTVTDNNQAIAWQNALTRVLVALGVHLEAARSTGSSFDEVMAEMTAAGDRRFAKAARNA